MNHNESHIVMKKNSKPLFCFYSDGVMSCFNFKSCLALVV